MTKRVSNTVIMVLMTAIIALLAVAVAIFAVNKKEIGFGVRLSMTPNLLASVEISTTGTADGDFNTIFNNHNLSAVDNDIIISKQNGVLALDLALVSPATIYFKISNYTTAEYVDDEETYPFGPALKANAVVTFIDESEYGFASYEQTPADGVSQIVPYISGDANFAILAVELQSMQSEQILIDLTLELEAAFPDLSYATASNGTTKIVTIDGKQVSTQGQTFNISTPAGLFNLASIVKGAVNSTVNAPNITITGGANRMEGATISMRSDITVSDFVPTYNNEGNLTGTNIPTTTNWVPIGTSSTISFKGTFDGIGHEISGIYINTDTDDQGVFGYVDNGSIQNLGLVNSYIKGYERIGGIAGGVGNATITDCYNTGKVSGDIDAGGITGYVGNATITNCYNNGNISAGTYYAGGIAGEVYNGTITYCYNTGNISGHYDVGGIAGRVYDGTTTITNCYNTGDTSGNYYAGGIAGSVLDGTITNCYNNGNITTGNNWVGGITGYVDSGTITNCYNTGEVSGDIDAGGIAGIVRNATITNCYNTGNITGNEYIGGIGGSVPGGTITNCYNTGNVSGNNYTGGIAGILESITNTITNCYNTGEVTGATCVGGVVGGLYYYSTTAITTFIINCYNTGKTTGTGDFVGGIIGGGIDGTPNPNNSYAVVVTVTVENCYNVGEVIGEGTHVGGIVGAVALLPDITQTSEFTISSTFTNCYNAGNISAEGAGSYAGGIAGDVDSTTTITDCYYLDGAKFLLSGGTNENGGLTAQELLTALNAYVASNSTITVTVGGATQTINLSMWKIVAGLNNGWPVFV